MPKLTVLAAWVLSAILSLVLVWWQVAGGLKSLTPEFISGTIAFDGILVATIALLVQGSNNPMFDRVGQNRYSMVLLAFLVFFSAGADSFSLLHPTAVAEGGSVILIGLSPGQGMLGLLGFSSFVLALVAWGALLAVSLVRELAASRQHQV